MSSDRSRVYVALSQSNQIAAVSTSRTQGILEIFNLGAAGMGTSPVDVVEASPGRLFVAFDDGRNRGRVVELRTVDRVVTVVADDIPIDASPRLLVDGTGSRLFVTNTQQPFLYALDLTDPSAPVLADSGAAVTNAPMGTPALSSTGSRLVLDTGDVVDSASLTPVATVAPGAVSSSADGLSLLRVSGPGAITVSDFESLIGQSALQSLACDGVDGLRAFPLEAGFVGQRNVEGTRDVITFTKPGEVCTVVQRDFDVMPFADLALLVQTMPDAGLYECIRLELFDRLGSATQFLDPADLDAIDCSNQADPVLSVAGLETFTELRSLDISDNRITTLEPLAPSADTGSPGVALETLAARDLPLIDASALLAMPTLRTVDLSDSSTLPCSQLDAIGALGLASFTPPSSCHDPRTTTLGGDGGDVVLDENNARVLVSVPATQEVLALSVPALDVVQRFAFANAPQGLALSADGSTLYVAFSDAPAIAYLDLTTGAVETVDIGAALDAAAAWDIAELAADRLLVTGIDSAFIVEVRADQGNAATRVAGEFRTGANPLIAIARDANAVYVGGTGIVRLDGNADDLPITAQRDDLGERLRSYSATADGALLYLGPVLNGTTLINEGYRRGEAAFVRASGEIIAPSPDRAWADEYDLVTLGRFGLFEGRRLLGCEMASLTAFGLLEAPREALVSLGGDRICVAADVAYR